MKQLKIGILAVSATVMMTYQNCSQVKFGMISASEATKLGTTPFKFDSNTKVAGVLGADGYPSENLRVKDASLAAANFVQDCSKPVLLPSGRSQSRYEYEKAQAIAKAAADVSNKTIPIEFAVSYGQADDRLALWAHKRAVLTEGNDSNTSFIPVGQKNNSMFNDGSTNVDAYYKVSHSAAKEDYILGKNCFFDTVQIVGDIKKVARTNDQRYDFITEASGDNRHKIHYMYYGWCDPSGGQKCADSTSEYGAGNYSADTFPNRLFGAWPHLEAGNPQIVKLFVADLRDKHFGLPQKMVLLPEERARGAEVAMNVKKEIDVKTLFRNRDLVIWNLSNSYKATSGDVFNGMKGVPQLISNMQLAGATGTLLASQYTPIVVDLGAEGVKTSSTFGGTFFNMASRSEIVNGVESFDFTQSTSWLGGDLVDTMSRQPASTDASMLADWNRQAEDGFLVVADSNGKVTSSRQLLGDRTIVNGKTYSNGFEALQAMADKKCDSLDSKNQYVGPWDGDLYAKKLQIWVDANRNGVVESDELKSLAAAGLLAINACNIVHSEAHDIFGNGTSLRSAFLFNSNKETLLDDDIVSRLETGVRSDGQDASFRLAIDLIFQVNETNTLEATAAPLQLAVSKSNARPMVLNN